VVQAYYPSRLRQEDHEFKTSLDYKAGGKNDIYENHVKTLKKNQKL
jgi:hypothetical protein